MSISLITKSLNDTLVYWGSPVDDGFGKNSFGDPIEISGKMFSIQKVFVDVNGKEAVSSAEAMVDRDLEFNGYLWKGSLSDSSLPGDPVASEEAKRIRGKEEHTTFRGTQTFRKVILV